VSVKVPLESLEHGGRFAIDAPAVPGSMTVVNDTKTDNESRTDTARNDLPALRRKGPVTCCLSVMSDHTSRDE